MSNEQWTLLTEYENWKTQKENWTVDVSIEAFRKEWEAKFDRQRIEEAVNLIYERDEDDLPGVISEVLDALIGDRPTVTDSTLGGPSTVTFV